MSGLDVSFVVGVVITGVSESDDSYEVTLVVLAGVTVVTVVTLIVIFFAN